MIFRSTLSYSLQQRTASRGRDVILRFACRCVGIRLGSPTISGNYELGLLRPRSAASTTLSGQKSTSAA